LEWKAKKQAIKDADREAKSKQRRADIASGKVLMSGREMFVANPDWFVDDDMAADSEEFVQQIEVTDPSVPVNIITATGTSLTRIAVKPGQNIESVPAVVSDASLFAGEDIEDFGDDEDDKE
jgi:hypothetical protein